MTTSTEENGTRTLSSLTTIEVGILLERLTQSSTVNNVLSRQSFTVTGKDLQYLSTVEDLVDLGLGEVLPKFKLRKLIEELLELQKVGVVSGEYLLPVTESVSVVGTTEEKKTEPKDSIDTTQKSEDNDFRRILQSLVNRNDGLELNYDVLDLDVFCTESPFFLQSYLYLSERRCNTTSSPELEVLLDLWYSALMFGEMCRIPNALSLMSHLLHRGHNMGSTDCRLQLTSTKVIAVLLDIWSAEDVEEGVLKKITLIFIAMLSLSGEEMLSFEQLRGLLTRCVQAKQDYETQDELYFILTLLHHRLLCQDEVKQDELEVLERDLVRILDVSEHKLQYGYIQLVVLHLLVDGDDGGAVMVRNKVSVMLLTWLGSGDGEMKEKELMLVCGLYLQLDNVVVEEDVWLRWPEMWARHVLTSTASLEVLLSCLLVLHHLLDRTEEEVSWSVFGTTGMISFLQLCCDRLQKEDGGDVNLVSKGLTLVLDLMLKMPILGLPSSSQQQLESQQLQRNNAPVMITAMLLQLQQGMYSKDDTTKVYVAYTAFHQLIISLFTITTTVPAMTAKLYKKMLLTFFATMQIPVLQRLLRDSNAVDCILNALLTCSTVFSTAKAHDEHWIWLRLRFLQMLTILLYQNLAYQRCFWMHGKAWLTYLQQSITFFLDAKEVHCCEDVYLVLLTALHLQLKTAYNVTQPFKGLQLQTKLTLIGNKLELDSTEDGSKMWPEYVVDDILGVAVHKLALQHFALQLQNDEDGNENAVQFLLAHSWTSFTQHFPCAIHIAQLFFLLAYDTNIATYMIDTWQLPTRLTQAVYQYSLTALFPAKKSKSPLKPNLNLVLLSVQLATMAILCKQDKHCITKLEDTDIVVMYNPTDVNLARLLIQILRIYPKDMVLPCYYVIFYTSQESKYAWQFTRVIPCFLDSNRVAELQLQSSNNKEDNTARMALKDILVKTSFRHKYILLVVLVITVLGLLLPHVLKFKQQLNAG